MALVALQRIRQALGADLATCADSFRVDALALAGAIADGDLGTHFPEDDPEPTEGRSLGFVEEFAGHLAQAGFAIGNVDCFVVLGTVRLRPHIEAMRRNLANAPGVGASRVSVKARSNDGIGPEGAGAACGAWATVLIHPVD